MRLFPGLQWAAALTGGIFERTGGLVLWEEGKLRSPSLINLVREDVITVTGLETLLTLTGIAAGFAGGTCAVSLY